MITKTSIFPFISKLNFVKKRIIIKGLIGFLIVAAILAGYFGVLKLTEMPKINLSALIASISISKDGGQDFVLSEEEINFQENLLNETKTYQATAEVGQGTTHLARKVLKDYLEEKEDDLNLSSEHKIYVEDYLKNSTEEEWLEIGQEISFSESLISEAINKSLELNENQLENLKQYSVLVTGL